MPLAINLAREVAHQFKRLSLPVAQTQRHVVSNHSIFSDHEICWMQNISSMRADIMMNTGALQDPDES
jgi:hypothetical protein